MKKPTVVRIAIALAGLALSLCLAMEGMVILTNYGIRTPGVRAAGAYAKSMPGWQGLNGAMNEELFVDWAFWFALLVVIYLFATRLWNWGTSKRSR